MVGEPRRRDYPNGSEGTWTYKKAVLPFVERHHDEFMLLDKGCHQILERSILKSRKFEPFPIRLSEAVRLTKTGRAEFRTEPKIINT